MSFTVLNNNPVEVSIKEYKTNFEFARLRLVHVRHSKKAKDPKRSKWVKEKKNNHTLLQQAKLNSSKPDLKSEVRMCYILQIELKSVIAVFACHFLCNDRKYKTRNVSENQTFYQNTFFLQILQNDLVFEHLHCIDQA